MKYVLASLIAVGLIGGSQVVTYGQDTKKNLQVSASASRATHAEEQGAKGTGQASTAESKRTWETPAGGEEAERLKMGAQEIKEGLEED